MKGTKIERLSPFPIGASIGVALLTCCLISGCATVRSFDSQKSANFQRAFSRLYVVTNATDPMGQPFADALDTAMTTQFRAAGVDSEVLTLTGLELDDAVDLGIAGYDPDGVLVIKIAGGTVMDATTVMNVLYDVSLFENDGKRRVWRAKVDFAPGGFAMNPQKRAEVLSKRLIEEMQRNGLIPGAAVGAVSSRDSTPRRCEAGCASTASSVACIHIS